MVTIKKIAIGQYVQMLQENAATQATQNSNLEQWKAKHPELSEDCGRATEVLGRIQAKFIEDVTQEILDNEEILLEGSFSLREFIDSYGMRLAQLNGLIQFVAQLSTMQE